MAKGELDSAEDSLRGAIKERPDYSIAYNSLGLVLVEMGREREQIGFAPPQGAALGAP